MDNAIKIGWSRTDITPGGPCMVAGQLRNRLATQVIDRLFASVLALECGGKKAVMISIDTASVRMQLLDEIRKRITDATGVPGDAVMASATHTHTAPQYGPVAPESEWNNLSGFRGNCGIIVEDIRKEHPDFVDSEQYFDFLVEKISSAAIEAWNSRKYGKIAYGCGTAVVGENRRLTMRDRGGVMYALEDDPALLNAEGHVDHTVNVMTTYTGDGKLTGMVINVACPSQVSEALSIVSSDYWNEVRAEVASRLGDDIFVLPQCSAAGDISPHKLLGRRADERMMLLRGQQKKALTDWSWAGRVYDLEYGIARRREIARRIAVALEDVLPVIADTASGEVIMEKEFRMLSLAPRLITEEEYRTALADVENLQQKIGNEYSPVVLWHKRVIERYKNPPSSVDVELHTLRLGDIVFATNPFELYLDYGDRIKGGSKAIQTFLIQLSAGAGTYLPSARSGNKGYGSVPASSIVTSDGGDTLVLETVKSINQLF